MVADAELSSSDMQQALLEMAAAYDRTSKLVAEALDAWAADDAASLTHKSTLIQDFQAFLQRSKRQRTE